MLSNLAGKPLVRKYQRDFPKRTDAGVIYKAKQGTSGEKQEDWLVKNEKHPYKGSSRPSESSGFDAPASPASPGPSKNGGIVGPICHEHPQEEGYGRSRLGVTPIRHGWPGPGCTSRRWPACQGSGRGGQEEERKVWISVGSTTRNAEVPRCTCLRWHSPSAKEVRISSLEEIGRGPKGSENRGPL